MALKISQLPSLSAITTDDYIPFTDVGTLATKKITFANFVGSFSSSGVWTPVITFTTPGDLSVAYSIQNGTYTKIDKLVALYFSLITSNFTHTTSSGLLQITGVPFTAAGGMDYNGALNFGGITQANYTQFTPVIPSGTTYINIISSAQGQNQNNVSAAQMPSGGTVLLEGAIIFRSTT